MSKYASKENLQYLWKKSKVYTDEKLSALPGAVGYRNGKTIVIDNLEPGDYILKSVSADGSTAQLQSFNHTTPVTVLKPSVPDDCSYMEICRQSGELRGRVRMSAAVTVVPDFAQSDESSPDFIRNKTHWSDYSLVLPLTTVSYDENIAAHILYDMGDLKAGAICRVIFNGTEYVCPVVVEDDGTFEAYILGNYRIMTETGDTGEPFVLIAYSREFAAAMGFRAGVILIDGGTDDITLEIHSGGVHKLDNIFLDIDWLPLSRETDLCEETTVDSAGTFVPYFEDSGAWDIIVNTPDVTVYWDGVRYDCTLSGNVLDGIGTGYVGEVYPFRINFIRNKFQVQYDDGLSHRVKLAAKTVNRMPREMLPASVDSVVLNSATADSTKKFVLTVDDSGTLTVTEKT